MYICGTAVDYVNHILLLSQTADIRQGLHPSERVDHGKRLKGGGHEGLLAVADMMTGWRPMRLVTFSAKVSS